MAVALAAWRRLGEGLSREGLVSLGDDAVAPCRLGAVHRCIGIGYKGVGLLVGASGRTDADVDWHELVADDDRG